MQDGKPAISHYHQCPNCHKKRPGYGSHFGNRAICQEDPISLCHVCLSKEFPKVTMRFSEAYREVRVDLISEAAKFTNREVGELTAGQNSLEWTRVFLTKMERLAAEI